MEVCRYSQDSVSRVSTSFFKSVAEKKTETRFVRVLSLIMQHACYRHINLRWPLACAKVEGEKKVEVQE